MRRFSLVCFLLILSGTSLPTYAQEAVQEPMEIGDSGEEYLRAIRLRGIDTDVTYFDPSAPPPKLNTEQEPPKPAEDKPQSDSSNNRVIPGLIVGGILLAVAYLFLRLGGRLTVSLGREAGNPDSTRPKIRGQAPVWAEKLAPLDEILRMQDRRRALVLLTQKVLATAIAANGILMQRSWTARDALRQLPESQGRELLRKLVTMAERVQFGGRDVSEDEFKDHVANCRYLLGPEAT
ncbi:DUF4129 domain-containing protein [Stappia sp. BW2]|nr:DUF4129 domain-containing protein [Stappia sp. BW2]